MHPILHVIWADYVQRVEADYQADLAAADAAYSEYVAPYQSARDLAYEYWQEHPDDAEAYAAYQQAQQDLDNAIAYATAMRDQAYAEAAARREARLADPYQDEQYANQEAEAYAAYYSALEQAGAAWAAAEQAAYDEWQAAMNAAESTYTETESQTWNQYLERIDQLNSQLEHTRLILEAAFQTAWNNFVRDWTEMETEAWDAYQRARAQMLRPPSEGERQVEPPAQPNMQPLLLQGIAAGPKLAQVTPPGAVTIAILASKALPGADTVAARILEFSDLDRAVGSLDLGQADMDQLLGFAARKKEFEQALTRAKDMLTQKFGVAPTNLPRQGQLSYKAELSGGKTTGYFDVTVVIEQRFVVRDAQGNVLGGQTVRLEMTMRVFAIRLKNRELK